MGMDDTLAATLRVGGAMVYPLLALAVVSFVIIVEKAFVFTFRARLPRRIAEMAGRGDVAWERLDREVAALGARNYVAGFLRAIRENCRRPDWWVESLALDEARQIETALGRWLWALETIVTGAPLLGLLGTITGMIRAFRLFGKQGLVDPGGVTGGVAEALLATGLGLLIALIALFAFNYFSQRQAQVLDEIERLGTRFIDRIRLDQQEGAREAA